MTVGTVRTQGTHLFVIDNITQSPAAIMKMACPTGISGLGGARDQIESSCLDTLGDKEFVGGLGNPGQVTIPFNLIPRDGSHRALFEMKEDGGVLKWMVALSEGTAPPTLTAGNFVRPAGRTVIEFDAFVSDVNIDIATNELVRGTLTLQRSGNVTFTAFIPV